MRSPAHVLWLVCHVVCSFKINLATFKMKLRLVIAGPALAKLCWMGIHDQGISVGCEHSVQSTLN